jgi:hypothetical protein
VQSSQTGSSCGLMSRPVRPVARLSLAPAEKKRKKVIDCYRNFRT